MRNVATPIVTKSKKVINGRGTIFSAYTSSRLDTLDKLRIKSNNEEILMKN